jgi:hypothetical protein
MQDSDNRIRNNPATCNRPGYDQNRLWQSGRAIMIHSPGVRAAPLNAVHAGNATKRAQ